MVYVCSSSCKKAFSGARAYLDHLADCPRVLPAIQAWACRMRELPDMHQRVVGVRPAA